MDFNDPINLRKFVFEMLLTSDANEEWNDKCSFEVLKSRLDICTTCEHFRDIGSSTTYKSVSCAKCECKLLGKVSSIDESCPIDKWGYDIEGWNKNFFGVNVSKIPEEYNKIFYDAGMVTEIEEDEDELIETDTTNETETIEDELNEDQTNTESSNN